jgi:sugar phosphate isomerase/epimerase
MSKIKVGLQLFTVRDEIEKDLFGALKQVANIGYQTVELMRYDGVTGEELKKMLDDLGLVACCSHFPVSFNHLDKLRTELGREIEFNLAIGSSFIATPWTAVNQFTTKEEFTHFYAALSMISQEAKKHGLQHLYHNHDFELQQRDGKYLLDAIYEAIDEDMLKAEFDLYWLKKAGVDPLAYILKYKGRCPIVHLKDMTGDGRQYFAELGSGIIDFSSIFTAAEEIGIQYYIVEQDQCERPSMESAKMSFDYLKSIGIA